MRLPSSVFSNTVPVRVEYLQPFLCFLLTGLRLRVSEPAGTVRSSRAIAGWYLFGEREQTRAWKRAFITAPPFVACHQGGNQQIRV